MRFCLAPVCGSLVGWAGDARSVCGRLWSVLNGSAVGDQRPVVVVPRPPSSQTTGTSAFRKIGRSTHHRHRPGLFRSMHACDWASKPPAAAAAARGATSGFPSLASLSAPSWASSVPSSSLPHDTSATSFPSPHDPASAICAWLQSARGGRYTRSVHACEHACDNLRAAAVISLTCHMSHLTYVPLTFLWFHPWPTTAPRLPVSASSSNP